MAWCEANGVDYVFGLGGNDVLDRQVEEVADDVRVRHAEGEAPLMRHYAETSYGAKSWKCQWRVGARIETATRVRIAFAALHPEAELFAGIARWFQPAAT